MNKEFKTLSEIYLTGKPQEPIKEEKKPFTSMSSLYRLVKEAEGENVVDIYAQADGQGEPQYVAGVPQEDYPRIKRAVMANATGGIRQYIEQLLILCGWPVNDKNKLLDKATNIFATYDASPAKFKDMVDNKEKNQLTRFQSLLQITKPFNLLKELGQDIKQMFKTEEDAQKCLKELIGVAFDIDRVSVGPGEFAITLITNAGKGKTGDLDVPYVGEVELKGDNGRIGKGKRMNTALGKLEEILVANNSSVFTHYIPKIVGGIEKKLNGLSSTESKIPGLPEVIASIQGQLQAIVETKYPNTYPSIGEQDIVNLNVLINNPPEGVVVPAGATGAANTLTTTEKSGSDSNLYNFNKLINRINDTSYQISTTNGFQIFFNTDHGLEYDDYIKALAEMRTEELHSSHTEELVKGIKTFVTPEVVKRLIEGDLDLLSYIGAAIQIAGYQSREGFEYILFFSKKTYNAIAIDTQGDNIGEVVSKVFKQMIKHSFKIPLSVDDTNSGFGITFTG